MAPDFLGGGKVAYSGKAEGEREKGGYPKGFHDWALSAETHVHVMISPDLAIGRSLPPLYTVCS